MVSIKLTRCCLTKIQFNLNWLLSNAGLANNNYRDHGTAVVSILGSIKDNIGLTGAAYSASEIKGYMEWTTVGYNRASAVSRSINASQAGDIILYEMQTGGKDGQYCLRNMIK